MELDERALKHFPLMLGLAVGTLLDLGYTPQQIADAFSRKNVLAAAEIVGKKNCPPR